MLERIRNCLPTGADVELRQMFGLDAYVCRGVMFASVQQGDLVVRLDSDAREEAMSLPGTTSWGAAPDDDDDYVVIPAAHVASDDMLRYWVNAAYENAESLSLSDPDAVDVEDDDNGMDGDPDEDSGYSGHMLSMPRPARSKAPAGKPETSKAGRQKPEPRPVGSPESEMKKGDPIAPMPKPEAKGAMTAGKSPGRAAAKPAARAAAPKTAKKAAPAKKKAAPPKKAAPAKKKAAAKARPKSASKARKAAPARKGAAKPAKKAARKAAARKSRPVMKKKKAAPKKGAAKRKSPMKKAAVRKKARPATRKKSPARSTARKGGGKKK